MPAGYGCEMDTGQLGGIDPGGGGSFRWQRGLGSRSRGPGSVCGLGGKESGKQQPQEGEKECFNGHGQIVFNSAANPAIFLAKSGSSKGGGRLQASSM